ncbi:MAG: CARDB domain-containing protein, partial [Candidatus Methanomethylophilaceae archaeon]|nr:CARDB domain-containing protein [Candidatus Methanomethylophilaceae archaeon]
AGESVLMTQTWSSITPTLGVQWVTFELQVTVNPDASIPEASYAGNQASHTFFVNDNRPDLALSYLATSVGSEGPLGEAIEIHFRVDNFGSSTASAPMLTLYLDNGTEVQIVNVTLSPIAAGANLNTSVSWSIRGDVGVQQITAKINEFNTTPERNSSNNQMSVAFEVTALIPELRLTSNMVNYKVGDLMVVWGTLLNANNDTERLASTPVVLTIRDGDGRLINTYTLTTDLSGYFRQEIPVTELMAGSTTITATATYGNETAAITLDRQISSGISDGGQSWWMWIIIILVMVLIIIIFSFYIYRYSIGKMVECGECHSLIPEASHRCPNCGVDFEVGTAKCSECGGWIPANSKKCPECGASFIGTIVTDEEESDYIQLMREGYGLFVDTFRAQAQEELGKKYNDRRFLSWWTDHPEHITFEEWLAKEEASRKEQTFKCPSCGTVNAKGAKQCIRCNRSFVRANTSVLEDEEKAAAPIRRVVRKRKVAEVPKKEATEDKETEEPALKKRTVLRKEDVEAKKEPEEEKEE